MTDVAPVNGTADRALSRADILSGAFTPEIEKVEVPEWGGHVFVKELSGVERDKWEISLLKGKGNKRETNLENLRAKLVAFTTVDSTGTRLFDDTDIPALGKRSSRALNRVFQVAQKLSGLTEEDIDELTTELGEDPSDGSGSASL